MNTCAKCRFYSTFLCYCHRHHDYTGNDDYCGSYESEREAMRHHHDYTGNDDYCGSYESEREAMRHCELQYGCV